MTDPLGGNGNGSAWWCEPTAELTNSPFYQMFSGTAFQNVDIPTIKAAIGQALASCEAAPVVNYLNWVLTIALKVQ